MFWSPPAWPLQDAHARSVGEQKLDTIDPARLIGLQQTDSRNFQRAPNWNGRQSGKLRRGGRRDTEKIITELQHQDMFSRLAARRTGSSQRAQPTFQKFALHGDQVSMVKALENPRDGSCPVNTR